MLEKGYIEKCYRSSSCGLKNWLWSLGSVHQQERQWMELSDSVCILSGIQTNRIENPSHGCKWLTARTADHEHLYKKVVDWATLQMWPLLTPSIISSVRERNRVMELITAFQSQARPAISYGVLCVLGPQSAKPKQAVKLRPLQVNRPALSGFS